LKSVLFYIVLISFGLSSCSTKKHYKQRPAKRTVSVEKQAVYSYDNPDEIYGYLETGPKHIELEMKKSNINLKYRLNKSSMRDTFNGIMDTLLVNNTFDVEEYNLQVKLSKKSEADLEFEGKKVLVNFPLYIEAEKETMIQKLEIEGEIHISAVCNIDINNDWQLTTDTELVDYYWLEKPKVKMGIITLPVEKIMNAVIEKAKHKVIDQIDETIKEKMSLKSQIVSVMDLINKPFTIDNVNDVGLTIALDDFSMTGVKNQFDWNEGIISVTGMGEVGRLKAIEESSNAVPVFSWLDQTYDRDTSNLYFNVDVGLDVINKVVKENFIGKKFSEKGKEIMIKDLEVKGLDEKLGIVADVEGSYNGQIFLSARPEYKTRSRRFVSKDIEINLLTKNILHKGLGWMLNGRIKSELDKTLQFSLDDIMVPMRAELANQIEQVNSSGELEVKASVQDLEIEEFRFSSESIHATIHLPMILELNVIDFNSLARATVGTDD